MMVSDQVRKLLADAKAKNATDIHICAGSPVLYRVGRDLVPATDQVLSPEWSRKLALGLFEDEEKIKIFERDRDADSMVAIDGGRFRVNISFNDGAVGAVVRILPETPKTLDELRLPSIVRYFAHRMKGLVLITGSTSQGKTTTMSAMIDEINTHYRKHIITIEDPIEYIHVNKKSIVRQREVGRDTRSFRNGLRAALRQDPDVIAIGEMRDYESIQIALTAAETGVLVFSTLHIISVDKMIERLLSYAPAEEEMHVRYLMADALLGVVHQELLPSSGEGKRVACEVLNVTDAARNLLRKKGNYVLRNVIATGAQKGMITMRQSIEQLLEEGAITHDVAAGVLNDYPG
jgi:twitching motility protein PilT